LGLKGLVVVVVVVVVVCLSVIWYLTLHVHHCRPSFPGFCLNQMVVDATPTLYWVISIGCTG
jgi:hypothetical protein